MGKKLSSSTLSTYYQMFSVFSLAALQRDSKQFCLHFENYRSGNGRKASTVEPRFNDLRYNDIPGITINNLLPAQQKLQ